MAAAAELLGVHYQTAYRWVRNGTLPAEMVAGRYLVSRSAAAELERSRRAPQAPPPPRPARMHHAAERMHAALVAGDEAAAVRIATRLVAEGTPILDLVEQVLAPSLRAIGSAWSTGDLTIWAEHRASAIVERLLGELAPNPRGRRRGTAAVAALSGDRHSLPTTMAAVALRADHWHVHHLGADLPAAEFIRFCTGNGVDVAVITVTQPDVAATAAAAAGDLAAAGVATLVGGAGQPLADLVARARTTVRRAADRPVFTAGVPAHGE